MYSRDSDRRRETFNQYKRVVKELKQKIAEHSKELEDFRLMKYNTIHKKNGISHPQNDYDRKRLKEWLVTLRANIKDNQSAIKGYRAELKKYQKELR
jgi:uncharacterized protein (DUF342 family)